MKKNDKNPPKDYIQNYQNALNNYTKTIKFYANNIQIIEGIKKIINEYKDSILSFQKRIIQIQKNSIKPLSDDIQKKFNASVYNEYLKRLDKIFNIQIESISNTINDIDQKLFNDNENNNNQYINNLNQNKNNLQNKQIKMEKNYLEYNSEYQKFMDAFFSIEEEAQKYFFYIRNKIKKDPNLKKYNNLITDANNAQNRFDKFHEKFQENNKSFFNSYENKMKELQKALNQKETYIENNINSFSVLLGNNIDSINKSFTEENKSPLIIDKNKDYDLFNEKNLVKIESHHEKEKYKIRALHTKTVEDYLSQENKEVLKLLGDELNLGDIIDPSNIILNEDDVFQVVKFFYGLFAYVDTTEYNINLEKKKFEVRKLTNKLLQPGLKQKKLKEYEDILPINEKEVESLKEYFERNREFMITFLFRLNNYRSLGVFSMPEREFELTSNFLKLILDCILKQQTEKDNIIINLTIIMSQTFYLNKNGEKYYLSNELKGHKLFRDLDFIKKYLHYYIKEELEKSIAKSKIKITEKSKQEIIFAVILSLINFFKETGLNKEQFLKIFEDLPKEYNLSEDFMNNINAIIE